MLEGICGAIGDYGDEDSFKQKGASKNSKTLAKCEDCFYCAGHDKGASGYFGEDMNGLEKAK